MRFCATCFGDYKRTDVSISGGRFTEETILISLTMTTVVSIVLLVAIMYANWANYEPLYFLQAMFSQAYARTHARTHRGDGEAV